MLQASPPEGYCLVALSFSLFSHSQEVSCTNQPLADSLPPTPSYSGACGSAHFWGSKSHIGRAVSGLPQECHVDMLFLSGRIVWMLICATVFGSLVVSTLCSGYLSLNLTAPEVFSFSPQGRVRRLSLLPGVQF